MASNAGDGGHPPHFFFFPAMAAGHTLPMVDLAKLFAARGTRATLVLTPSAAAAVDTAVSNCRLAGQSLAVELIHFPASEAGVPSTCQSMDRAANREEAGKLLASLPLLEPAFRRLVDGHRPDCVVSDVFLPWTADVSESFGVPRVAFTGSSCFAYCANHAVRKLSPQATVASDDEPFVIPGLPDEIYMTRAKLPNESASPSLHELFKKVEAAQAKTYGLIMNSFHELESGYIKHLQISMATKTWSVGPVSLCNRDKSEMKERGLKQSSSSSSSDVQTWLDARKPRSVLYICFGSTCTATSKQMEETAAALESIELPFIWVVKESEALPQGFEEKVGRERGLVIRGWAPQILILGHGSVGGFVTHCGWNSVLEGLTHGLPMVTWPAFAEQFYNEKLVTELLRVGVGVGVGRWRRWEEVGVEREVVGKGRIVEAVRRVMGAGVESEGMRRRVAAVAAAAESAVAVGGSSYVELGCLVEEVKSLRDGKKETGPNHYK